MNAVLRHAGRCLVAGIIAVLPIGGTILAVVLVEQSIAGSWLDRQGFYFPGLGILLAVASLYLLGLFLTTFGGRWLWRGVDRLLRGLPLLGPLYDTLKQVLGYGEGKDAAFHRVVMVASPVEGAEEVGLVTNEVDGPDGRRLVIFVPGSPNPTNGRLLYADPASVRSLDATVHDALRTLVSAGKSPIR